MDKLVQSFDVLHLQGVNSLRHTGRGTLKRRIVEFLATGFYSGKSPWAPGTMGTLVAIPIVILMSYLSPIAYMLVTFAIVLASVIISQLHENTQNVHDSQEIVIDEIVGFMITMTWLPINGKSLLLGFLLFRLFDILKPFPIRLVDRKIQGGLGVVADDVLAGVFASILMQVIYTQTTWLEGSWIL